MTIPLIVLVEPEFSCHFLVSLNYIIYVCFGSVCFHQTAGFVEVQPIAKLVTSNSHDLDIKQFPETRAEWRLKTGRPSKPLLLHNACSYRKLMSPNVTRWTTTVVSNLVMENPCILVPHLHGLQEQLFHLYFSSSMAKLSEAQINCQQNRHLKWKWRQWQLLALSWWWQLEN